MHQCDSQAFEVLHLTEGIGLDGTNSILAQVPVGTLHYISHQLYTHTRYGYNCITDFH